VHRLALPVQAARQPAQRILAPLPGGRQPGSQVLAGFRIELAQSGCVAAHVARQAGRQRGDVLPRGAKRLQEGLHLVAAARQQGLQRLAGACGQAGERGV
jgi:hypothetical protein